LIVFEKNWLLHGMLYGSFENFGHLFLVTSPSDGQFGDNSFSSIA
jgi:hypothetical protein